MSFSNNIYISGGDPALETDERNEFQLPAQKILDVAESTGSNTNGNVVETTVTQLPPQENLDVEETTVSNINQNLIGTTVSNVNANDEGAFLTQPPIIDEHAEEMRRQKLSGPELYEQGGLPRPRFVMLGQQGVGKVRRYNIYSKATRNQQYTSNKLYKSGYLYVLLCQQKLHNINLSR